MTKGLLILLLCLMVCGCATGRDIAGLQKEIDHLNYKTDKTVELIAEHIRLELLMRLDNIKRLSK